MFSNRDLKKMIFPLVGEQILVILVGMLDTAMVSYAGEAAVSGVSLTDMLNYFFMTVFAAIATGGAVIVSQYLGGQDIGKAKETSGQLFLTSGIFSLGCAVICLLFNRHILQLLFGAIEEDVMAAAAQYFLVTACSFPFLGIYNAGAALFRSMQRTKDTMYVSLLMNVVNVAGNTVGIFVLHAGVLGVAIPTLLSRMVAAFAMTVLAFQKQNPVYVEWKNIFCKNTDMMRRILKIGVPNGIENGLFALGRVLVTSIIALFGTTQIAANGVANSIDGIAIIVVNSINLAIVTVTGQCVGAQAYGEAKKYIRKLMSVSYVSTFLLGAAVCLSLPLLRGFYDVSEDVWNLSCILIFLHNVMAALLHPTSFNLSNALRAAGDVKFTMYAGVLSMILFRLGVAAVCGIVFNMGIFGVWAAMGMDWLGRSMAFAVRYKSGKWKDYRAI